VNVLVIVTDQQRADHTGFGGSTVVHTPHLDRLADRGMAFSNAWVANPVCMPNRSTIMTGRMPSVHGVVFNDRSLEWGANTHVRQFRRAGWRTGLFGKSHLQHGMSRAVVDPTPLAAAVDHSYPENWDTWEHSERYRDSAPEVPPDFYGFERVELSIDHGGRISGHHLQWALKRGARISDIVVSQTPASPARRRSSRWWQIYQPPYDEEFHSTSFVTDRTIEFIQRSAASGQNWLAWASFPDPHHPLAAPGRWYERYDPSTVPLPESFSDDAVFAHVPEYLRRTRRTPPSAQARYVTPCGTDDADLVREFLAATYGLIEFIDDGVGQILGAIDALGQTDQTIVVFTSDHGDMGGDHGLLLKGYMPFRGVLNVPLLIVDPRRKPGRTTSLAGSIDIGPTLLDLCDVAPHDGIQGRSLAPVLDDPHARVRASVLIEDDMRPSVAHRRGLPSRIRTLVTDELKYTRYGDGSELLFDLRLDPHELHDCAHEGDPRLAGLREMLINSLLEHTDDARGAPVTTTLQ
jgi:arylsulfatase A-like enzyme